MVLLIATSQLTNTGLKMLFIFNISQDIPFMDPILSGTIASSTSEIHESTILVLDHLK